MTAAADVITLLEAAFGHTLPPEYRAFVEDAGPEKYTGRWHVLERERPEQLSKMTDLIVVQVGTDAVSPVLLCDNAELVDFRALAPSIANFLRTLTSKQT